MLIVAILAIVATPLTLFVSGRLAYQALERMLSHMAEQATVGGQPLKLVLSQMEEQAIAAKDMREEQAQMLEDMKLRRREALGS